MRKGGYLPANCLAVEKEEYEDLKRKAELYDMYQRQSKVTTLIPIPSLNGVFLPKDEYNDLLKKAEMCDHMIALENSRAAARMEFE